MLLYHFLNRNSFVPNVLFPVTLNLECLIYNVCLKFYLEISSVILAKQNNIQKINFL